jgi:hypothetical protein
MRKYWVLAIGWPEGVHPNDDLWEVIANKAGSMMLDGKLVLGTLGSREFPLGKPNAAGSGIAKWLPDWRQAWVRNITLPVFNSGDNAEFVAALSDSSVTGVSRGLRIFTSESAALEFADFVLAYGADFARILDEEEVAELSPLPDDQYIDAMIVDPADTARVNLLQSKIVTAEMIRYYRENGTFPPGGPDLL